MALRDVSKRPLSFSTITLSCFFLSVTCLLFLSFSTLRSPSASPSGDLPSYQYAIRPGDHPRTCNYSEGSWIFDPNPVASRYDHTCKEIFKGWNCIAGGKSNGRDLLRWKWQPSGCVLPRLDPLRFLELFRNTNIGFVGDSLNRNMFVSLFCMLKSAASGEVKKWRPAGADRGFTFLKYNVTVAYHRTNLLVQYGRWSASDRNGVLESLGFKQGYRVDVDVPEHTWAEALSFHQILIFNTGHWWWARSKFDPINSPLIFFEKGKPVVPPVNPEIGIDIALKYMIRYVEKYTTGNTMKFFRTQSPRHFEGGEWDHGGSCRHMQPLLPGQVEELFSLENNGTNREVRVINQHLHKALEGSSFHILDIAHLSEFRADAHPSTAGGKKHEDCMHWCLPGLTDTWNDILSAYLQNAVI